MKIGSIVEKNNLGYIFIFLGVLFLCINFRNNISINKFLFEWGVNNLVSNYQLFNNNFFAFVINTMLISEGDSASGWNSFYYLLPLFIFLKFMGGLNLFNLHLFTFFSSIPTLFIFHYLLKKYWGDVAANIGVYFLVFSSFFFNLAISGSYHTPSILVALILIIFIFKTLDDYSIKTDFCLGMITGLSWYYYGPLRFISLLVIGIVCLRKDKFYKHILYFLTGFMIISLWGFILTMVHKGHFFDQEHIFYKEPGYEKIFYLVWLDNLRSFGRIILGEKFAGLNYRLINKVLVLPLFIGIAHIVKTLRHNKVNKIFLSYVITICILPIFVTAFHYQPRRYILYVIPIFMLIGIGGSRIVYYLNLIKNRTIKIILSLIFIVMSFYIIWSELGLAFNNTPNNTREYALGEILRFGRLINKYFYTDLPIFYLQEVPHRLLEVDSEASLFTLILRDKNITCNVGKITGLEQICNDSKEVYIIKSPYIKNESFIEMCEKENLSYKLLLSLPYKSGSEIRDAAFSLYICKKCT